jgi:uncharacterized protein
VQFILIAHDWAGQDALARRMAARDEHLKLGRELHDAGHWLYAAGIVGDAGTLVGSMIVCDFASRQEMQEKWLGREPYIVHKVWQKIEIRGAAVAPFCALKKD